jgi:putative peptidoglycan lipid II flippase
VIPSAVAFIILGDVVVATVYRSGHFGKDDVTFVWTVLAGSGVGLLASTSGRLYSSAFYALRNTRTPLNFALIRVALTLVLGYFFALPLPRLLGIDHRWGVPGLTLSAGIAGWVEFILLRRALHARIGAVASLTSRITRLWLAALLAAAIGYGLKLVLSPYVNQLFPRKAPLVLGPSVLVVYGACYLALAALMGIAAPGTLRRLFRR